MLCYVALIIMNKKVKVTIELEVNVVKGLNSIANTVFDVVEEVIESGLRDDDCKGVCKILNINSNDIDVTRFHESGEDYKKGISYKNEKEYLERDDT